MEELSKHISELLFDHDCVIVPALGGFLASNQSSKILLPKHIIYPPYRHIAFNTYLKHNDGLLANHLVESKNINYNEALNLIENFVSFCIDSLEKGKKFILTEIGTLYYDKEKNIQFEPFRNFNHLKESFGLEPLNYLPIQRGENAERKFKEVENTLRPSVRPEKIKSRSVLARNKTYIGAVIVGAALSWFAINIYLAGPKRYDSTSLNPFDSQETTIQQGDTYSQSPSDLKFNNQDNSESNVVVVPSVDVDSTTTAMNTPVEVPEIKETIPVTVTIPAPQKPLAAENQISATPGIRKHYVIAGVFKIKDNADKMLLSLKQQGFANAQIIETNNRHYVTFENATSRNGALGMIDTLKEKNIDSWIWRH